MTPCTQGTHRHKPVVGGLSQHQADGMRASQQILPPPQHLGLREVRGALCTAQVSSFLPPALPQDLSCPAGGRHRVYVDPTAGQSPGGQDLGPRWFWFPIAPGSRCSMGLMFIDSCSDVQGVRAACLDAEPEDGIQAWCGWCQGAHGALWAEMCRKGQTNPQTFSARARLRGCLLPGLAHLKHRAAHCSLPGQRKTHPHLRSPTHPPQQPGSCTLGWGPAHQGEDKAAASKLAPSLLL